MNVCENALQGNVHFSFFFCSCSYSIVVFFANFLQCFFVPCNRICIEVTCIQRLYGQAVGHIPISHHLTIFIDYSTSTDIRYRNSGRPSATPMLIHTTITHTQFPHPIHSPVLLTHTHNPISENLLYMCSHTNSENIKCERENTMSLRLWCGGFGFGFLMGAQCSDVLIKM